MTDKEPIKWQQFLTRLRDQFDVEKQSKGKRSTMFSFWQTMINTDNHGHRIDLTQKKYTLDTLQKNKITYRSFILAHIPWAVMHDLGYTISDGLKLGYTTDAFVTSDITLDHLLHTNNKPTVISNPTVFKQIITDLWAATKNPSIHIEKWKPADIFHLGFDKDTLHNTFKIQSYPKQDTTWHQKYRNFFGKI